MGLAGGVLLIRSWACGELGKEVRERGSEGEGSLPFECVLGEFAEVAVGGEDVEVAGVERRNGDGAAPEDEVLSVFADLTEREDVALAYLIKSEGKFSTCAAMKMIGSNLRLSWF